jgi:hypothetical protein
VDPDVFEDAFDNLPEEGHNIIEGTGEFILWRHQHVGDRRAESRNAMGMDPAGTTWETDDRYVEATKQGLDFYGQFLPIKGDLLVRLASSPQSRSEAREAREIGYYNVITSHARRTGTGELAHVRIETEPDRSGQWSS